MIDIYTEKDKISIQELYKATLEISDIKSDVASSMTDYYLSRYASVGTNYTMHPREEWSASRY